MAANAAREGWRLLYRLLMEGESHSRMQEASAATGVTPGIMKTLMHLEPGSGVPMRDLAEHWRCDASYVTTLADSLEAHGLAERRPHPTDRRVKMIALTAAGVAAREKMAELLFEPPSSFDALTPGEQKQFRDLMRKLVAADQRLNADRPEPHVPRVAVSS